MPLYHYLLKRSKGPNKFFLCGFIDNSAPWKYRQRDADSYADFEELFFATGQAALAYGRLQGWNIKHGSVKIKKYKAAP